MLFTLTVPFCMLMALCVIWFKLTDTIQKLFCTLAGTKCIQWHFGQSLFLMSCAVGNAPGDFLVDAAMLRNTELIRTVPFCRAPGSKQK